MSECCRQDPHGCSAEGCKQADCNPHEGCGTGDKSEVGQALLEATALLHWAAHTMLPLLPPVGRVDEIALRKKLQAAITKADALLGTAKP